MPTIGEEKYFDDNRPNALEDPRVDEDSGARPARLAGGGCFAATSARDGL